MGLIGDLKDLNIANIIQLKCNDKETSQLTINSKGREAVVFFDRGEIVYAKFGDFKGEQALYKILRISEGDFKITEDVYVPERNVFGSWKSLLLEGMKVMDETEKEKEEIIQSLRTELKKEEKIKALLIVTKRGEIIVSENFDDPELYSAMAAFLCRKGNDITNKLNFGPVNFAGYSTPQNQFFFLECNSFRITIATERRLNIDPIYSIINTVKEKLKSSEKKSTEDQDKEPG